MQQFQQYSRTKIICFLSKANQKRKEQNTKTCTFQGNLSCNTSQKLNKKHQTLYIFQPKKMSQKITYQVNLIYLPSKFSLLTK